MFMSITFLIGAYSTTLACTCVHTYIRPVSTFCSIRTRNGFGAISFEHLGVLDSHFIHRYMDIILKYRSK